MTDYTFLPWVRRGVSRSLTGAVTVSGPGRAALAVSVAVNGTPVSVPMALHGPEDAIGLAAGAVARVDPVPGAVDAEPFLFASIELVPADLPWLLTPGGPDGNGRLLPWLALVVVPRGAGQLGPAPGGGLDRLAVTCSELPPPDEAWAWAHVQVLGALTGPAADSLDAEPSRWRARILSPRRLDPGKSYLAALVPVFAAGVAAGLGVAPPAHPLAYAWDPTATGTVTLPVYHSWSFATSTDADFETLARRLVARELPEGVGRLPVDFSQPGTGVHGTSDALWVEGALGRIGDAPPALPADAAVMSADIARLVARSASPLVVGPPLYGPGPEGSAGSGASGSAGSSGSPVGPPIPAAGWQHEVNVDPRVRAITGVGAAVVGRDQEALVASAWRQVGDMRAANRALGWLTLARTTGSGLYRRHFARASVGALTQWSAPAQSQVQMDPQAPTTLAAMVSTTALSPAALGTAARRLLRSTGPLITRALAGVTAVMSAPSVAPAAPAATTTTPSATPGDVTAAGATTAAPTTTARVATGVATATTGVTTTGVTTARPDLVRSDPVTGTTAPARSTGSGGSAGAAGSTGAAGTTGSTGAPSGGTGPVTGTGHGPVVTGGHGPVTTGGHGPVVTGGGVIIVQPAPQTDAPAGLVTLERVRQLMGNPSDLAGFGLDGLTSALVRQRALLRIASALVDENGGSSGLPPNSHATFAAAAEPTQDAVLAQLATARGPLPTVNTATLDRARLLTALDPAPRFVAIGARRVSAPPTAGSRDPLDPVRVAPDYPQPAVDSLVAVAPELLLPGLDAVPVNTVTLATTDQRFVEAFLLGMNHELERELRWRGYPTVPGSTSFRRFWDSPPGQLDITEIADWATDSALGTHGGDSGSSGSGGPGSGSSGGSGSGGSSSSGSGNSSSGADTVLVVRGDLVRRFPGIAVTAIPLVNDAPNPDPSAELSPVLRGTLDPDLLYAGFSFPPTQAAGYAYVLTQQPGAPRFGLDEGSDLDAASVAQRNDLAWSQLGDGAVFATAAGPLAGRTISDAATSASAVWGRNAADMAWLTRQAPIRLVLLGPELLSGMGAGPS